jgi:hypothetical protein
VADATPRHDTSVHGVVTESLTIFAWLETWESSDDSGLKLSLNIQGIKISKSRHPGPRHQPTPVNSTQEHARTSSVSSNLSPLIRTLLLCASSLLFGRRDALLHESWTGLQHWLPRIILFCLCDTQFAVTQACCPLCGASVLLRASP